MQHLKQTKKLVERYSYELATTLIDAMGTAAALLPSGKVVNILYSALRCCLASG